MQDQLGGTHAMPDTFGLEPEAIALMLMKSALNHVSDLKDDLAKLYSLGKNDYLRIVHDQFPTLGDYDKQKVNAGSAAPPCRESDQKMLTPMEHLSKFKFERNKIHNRKYKAAVVRDLVILYIGHPSVVDPDFADLHKMLTALSLAVEHKTLFSQLSRMRGSGFLKAVADEPRTGVYHLGKNGDDALKAILAKLPS